MRSVTVPLRKACWPIPRRSVTKAHNHPQVHSLPDWVDAFKQDVHFVILVSGESHPTVAEKLAEVEEIFHTGAQNASVHEIFRIVGDVRPGKEKGHEQCVPPGRWTRHHTAADYL